MYSINAALSPFGDKIDHYFIQVIPQVGDTVLIEAVIFVFDTLDTSLFGLLARSARIELAIQMEKDLRNHAFALGEDIAYWQYEARLVVVPYVN